jgi:thiosulfate reductase cytochrome b subunit
MPTLATSHEQEASRSRKVIQPAWVRTLHWINAVAMIVMIMSGWQIYNASPLFNFVTRERASPVNPASASG